MLCLGAGHALSLPVNGEVRQIQRAWRARLPAGVDMDRPQQVNRVRVAAVQDAFGADVAGIDQMLLRQKVLLHQLCMDRLQRVVVLLRRGCGLDLRDEVRQVVVATFGHVHLVADPL